MMNPRRAARFARRKFKQGQRIARRAAQGSRRAVRASRRAARRHLPPPRRAGCLGRRWFG